MIQYIFGIIGLICLFYLGHTCFRLIDENERLKDENKKLNRVIRPNTETEGKK